HPCALQIGVGDGGVVRWRSAEEGAAEGAEEGDALLAHPDDCRLFYYCDGAGAPVCRQCPAGLHFSPDTHVCDQPDHAGCQLATTTA
ncbi:peritrophin-1-like, partial [Choristoneura fumiferana]|uniref:peritrophin-1-like n=1 Tax=Choristoneura fumiferana TaxID=7141 RepID=UPI003D15D00A